MYKQRKAVLTELKGATLAIGQHHDDASGLPFILHQKSSVPGKSETDITCLAAKIEELYTSESLELLDGRRVRCTVRCCLDLAAAR
eukprot:5973358-Pleurochrysis_carterae.AAC.1